MWREAEDGAWGYAEYRRDGSGVSHRCGKEWASKLREQEEVRAAVERESRTVVGRFRIWRADRSWRDLVGAVLGRANVLDGWRKELARHQRDERTALGKTHAESAGQFERRVRRTYEHDVRRAVPAVLQSRAIAAREREMLNRIVNRTPPRPPQRGPDRSSGPSR